MQASEWQTVILQVCMCLVKTKNNYRGGQDLSSFREPLHCLAPPKPMHGESWGLMLSETAIKATKNILSVRSPATLKLRTLGPTQSTFNLIKWCFSFFGVKTKILLNLPHGLIQRLGPAVWTQISTTHASLQNSSMDLEFVQEESWDPTNFSSKVLAGLSLPRPAVWAVGLLPHLYISLGKDCTYSCAHQRASLWRQKSLDKGELHLHQLVWYI